MLDLPLAETELSVRVINTLEKRGIFLVRNLLTQTRDMLLDIANFGDKTMTEITDVIVGLGLEPPKAWEKPKAPRKGRSCRSRKRKS